MRIPQIRDPTLQPIDQLPDSYKQKVSQREDLNILCLDRKFQIQNKKTFRPLK